jgi:hypothetical protein
MEGGKDIGISPEEEFWGHCSNIQAFVESGYNPNVLHSSMSVPLLRELIRYGNIDVLSALLYWLDTYWIEYEKEYDSRFVVERRRYLYDTFWEIIKPFVEKDNIVGEFVIQCRLLDSIVNLFPFARWKCSLCEDYYYKAVDEQIICHIYYRLNGTWRYDELEICGECYDNILEYEIEYCGGCDMYYYSDYTIYFDSIGECYCEECFIHAILQEGMNEYEMEYYGNLITDDQLKFYGYEFNKECKDRNELYDDWETLNTAYKVILRNKEIWIKLR